MNTSKFSLADLLTVLGATCFGFFCFLSFNFLSLGETGPSVVKALVIALILAILAFLLKLLKKTSRNFKTCIIWEWVLLLLFAGAAFFAVFPFSHYFTVLDKKTAIQDTVTANLTQAEGMYPQYEEYANNRLQIYKRKLFSIVAAKTVNPTEYREYGFEPGTSDSVQIDSKMFILHAKLFPSNYDSSTGTKQVAIAWLTSARKTLESKWAFTFGIVDIIKQGQINITKWNNELIDLSKFRAQGEIAKDFEYQLSFSDVTDKITQQGKPSPVSIGIALGLYGLMLLLYFVSKRHTRYPGLKVIFGTRGAKENEL